MRIKRLVIDRQSVIAFLFLVMIGIDLFSVGFSYLDEIVEMISIFILVLHLKNKNYMNILLCMITLFLSGILGNLLSEFSRSQFLVVSDYLMMIKFPVVLMGCFIFLKNANESYRCLLKKLYGISAVVTVYMGVNCLWKYVTFGGRVCFLNTEYAGIAGLYAFAFAAIIYSYSLMFKERMGFDILLIGINLIVIILTETSSALVFIAFCGLYVLKDFVKKYYKVILVIMAPIAIYAIYSAVAYKIVGYFMTASAPRFKLYKEALTSLAWNFPVGYGFSLFGSTTAAINYSPVYSQLGWNDVWEMRKGSPFLIDAFYPAVIGETGLIGVLAYSGICYVVFHIFRGISKRNQRLLSMPQLLIIVVFLSGITSNFMNSVYGIVMGIVICTVFYCDKELEYNRD